MYSSFDTLTHVIIQLLVIFTLASWFVLMSRRSALLMLSVPNTNAKSSIEPKNMNFNPEFFRLESIWTSILDRITSRHLSDDWLDLVYLDFIAVCLFSNNWLYLSVYHEFSTIRMQKTVLIRRNFIFVMQLKMNEISHDQSNNFNAFELVKCCKKKKTNKT